MWSDGIWVVWGMEHLTGLITHKYLDSPRLWEGLQPTSILLDWFYSIRTHLFFNSRWLWAWLLSEQTDHKELAVKESKVKQGEEMVKSLQSLSGATLSGATLYGATLSGATLSGAQTGDGAKLPLFTATFGSVWCMSQFSQKLDLSMLLTTFNNEKTQHILDQQLDSHGMLFDILWLGTYLTILTMHCYMWQPFAGPRRRTI